MPMCHVRFYSYPQALIRGGVSGVAGGSLGEAVPEGRLPLVGLGAPGVKHRHGLAHSELQGPLELVDVESWLGWEVWG